MLASQVLYTEAIPRQLLHAEGPSVSILSLELHQISSSSFAVRDGENRYGRPIRNTSRTTKSSGLVVGRLETGLVSVEAPLDAPHRLLRFIWLLSGSNETQPVEFSGLFDRIIEMSSKGYLDYGFKPGRWVAGRKEFLIRSQGLASDVAFLAKQGLIEIENNGSFIKISPEGRETAENVRLDERIESLLATLRAESPSSSNFRSHP